MALQPQYFRFDGNYAPVVLCAYCRARHSTRINDQEELDHILIDDETIMIDNKFGIPEPLSGFTLEPELIDLVFVPLLGFDEAGNRVGYGKGYYDKFLATCRQDVVIIGLSFLEAVKEIVDTDPWDVPLHYCITPNRVYEF